MTDEFLRDLVGESKSDKEKKARLSKAENDFFYFCKTYLPHYFSAEPAPYHKILIDIANDNALTKSAIKKLKPFFQKKYHSLLRESENLKAVVDVEPRGFSKSTRWTFAYPLWRLLFGKSKFACIFCSSKEMAESAVQNIKIEIETNDVIWEDFGECEGSVWKSDFISLENGSALKGFGEGSAVRGVRYKEHRPDLVICDDVLKDESARTKAQRDKIYNWFLRAVLPLGQNAFTIIVNTIFHYDDLPSRLLKRITEGELSDWAGFRFQAFAPNGESLWPAYWTVEKLNEKKRELGSAAFSTEYMNEPVSDEERIFKSDWFKFYESVDVRRLRVFMGVDPSAGKHDEFAIFTLGVSEDGTLYELDEWAECCSVDEAVTALVQKYIAFSPIAIGFESVGFQTIYKRYILEKAARAGVYLPIREMKTGGVGKERVLALSPLIENGMMKFRTGHKKTIGQLLMYPKSDFDDLQDALFYAFEVSKKTAKEVFAFVF